ncbi:hypothetical protein LJC56_02705 [Christensenellaceae bacterium OttesenSCG-928-K19]|nr:hypothetical protein [Christensenellaceae bacterium OttesenSCG-928-K19]
MKQLKLKLLKAHAYIFRLKRWSAEAQESETDLKSAYSSNSESRFWDAQEGWHVVGADMGTGCDDFFSRVVFVVENKHSMCSVSWWGAF